MGGKVDWTAVPLIGEMLGVVDYEDFITQLAGIRNWFATTDEEE